ncbi:MAG: hypothetical protein IAE66_09725 [Xanthomonadaceae bacterium]|nr:hypothetical protein [Xanthomonadaceae bacterium]
MRQGMMLVLLAMCLSGCASVERNDRGWIEPTEAIRAANEDPQHGVRGHFVMTVKAIGGEHEWVFLNSERDYRDQRNLTIKMRKSLVPKVERRLGVPFDELKNRRIVVQGTARRVRILFLNDAGRPSGKYYFQTHVAVTSETQIDFAK